MKYIKIIALILVCIMLTGATYAFAEGADDGGITVIVKGDSPDEAYIDNLRFEKASAYLLNDGCTVYRLENGRLGTHTAAVQIDLNDNAIKLRVSNNTIYPIESVKIYGNTIQTADSNGKTVFVIAVKILYSVDPQNNRFSEGYIRLKNVKRTAFQMLAAVEGELAERLEGTGLLAVEISGGDILTVPKDMLTEGAACFTDAELFDMLQKRADFIADHPLPTQAPTETPKVTATPSPSFTAAPSAEPVEIDVQLTEEPDRIEGEVSALLQSVKANTVFMLCGIAALILLCIASLPINAFLINSAANKKSEKRDRELADIRDELASIRTELANTDWSTDDNRVGVSTDFSWLKSEMTALKNNMALIEKSISIISGAGVVQKPSEQKHIDCQRENLDQRDVSKLLDTVNERLVNASKQPRQVLSTIFKGCQVTPLERTDNGLFRATHSESGYIMVNSPSGRYILAWDTRCGIQTAEYSQIYDGVRKTASRLASLPVLEERGGYYKLISKGKVE